MGTRGRLAVFDAAQSANEGGCECIMLDTAEEGLFYFALVDHDKGWDGCDRVKGREEAGFLGACLEPEGDGIALEVVDNLVDG